MTINTTSTTSGPFVGTDTTPVYPYGFKVQLSSEIIVTETDLSAIDTILVEGTDYSVSGVGDNGGGNVTRLAGNLPTGITWNFARTTEVTQKTDFTAQGPFLPVSHEDAFDKLTQILQEILALAISLPTGSRADQIFSFDSAGDPEANISADAVRALIAGAFNTGVAMTSDTFVSDGILSAYVLSITPVGTNALLVTLDGVVQEPTTDYTVSGSTITFVGVPDVDVLIVVRNLGNTVDVVVSGFTTLLNSATPNVLGGKLFLTGGTTTITDFLSGSVGQEITIMSEHAITITDGTNIFLAGSANFVMASTDSLTLIQKADGNWYEKSRSVN